MEKAMKLIKTLIAALLLTAGVAHADGVDLTPPIVPTLKSHGGL